ncbi:acyltransferase [Mesorhizobium sp. M0106]|uniref:acyltransferase family protein n=1 Tax=Mesorhizobium sp. M0106 TaxID=2956880 RepID=UPI00333BCB07
MIKKVPTISGLHYLRAIATVLVVVTHNVSAASLDKYFGPGTLTRFFTSGGGEVDFFFMMSGFIMVVTATNSATGAPRYTPLEFLFRRAVRLLPMLYLAVAFFNVALMVSGAQPDFWGSLRTLIIWPVGEVTPSVAWTIRYEVVFYAVFALCFLIRSQLWWFLLLWAALPLARYVLTGPSGETDSLASFIMSPFNIEFGIGVLLALSIRKWKPSFTFSGQIFSMIVLSLAIRASVVHFGLEIRTLAMVVSISPLLLVTMLVAVGTTTTRESRLGLALGDASYSIFLFHQPCMPVTLLILAKTMPWLPSSVAALISSLVGIAVGYLAHIFVEKRIQRYFEPIKTQPKLQPNPAHP